MSGFDKMNNFFSIIRKMFSVEIAADIDCCKFYTSKVIEELESLKWVVGLRRGIPNKPKK